MRKLLLVVGVLSILLVLVPTPKANTLKKEVRDPLKAGPYPVGVTTTVFVDSSRTDNVTKEARTLVTEIWYPATDDARNLPKNKFSDFIPGGPTPQFESLLKLAYKKTTAELNAGFWNFAVRDARVREGKFPLIIFSHGNGGARMQNTFWCDYLASHGYIIVSADHTANARVTVIKGKPVLYNVAERNNSALDRPKDMSFLLDQMTLWNDGADSRFSGRIDLTRPVAAGMSFGSMTAILVANLDPRFKAVIGMSGAPRAFVPLTVPTLLMLGSEDLTIGEEGNARIREQYEKQASSVLLMEMKNGGHYSFTDIFKLNAKNGDGAGSGTRRVGGDPFEYTGMERTYEMINAYSLAFLGLFVRGEQDYLPYLTQNHWPKELTWKVKGVDAKQATIGR